DGKYYYGSTNDLIQRLNEHRKNRVRTTSRRLPIELVYFEEFETQDQARKREHA
ncbi:MAG: GIY-YIG nuclease family protein, partial [Phycisphaerales bacterium]